MNKLLTRGLKYAAAVVSITHPLEHSDGHFDSTLSDRIARASLLVERFRDVTGAPGVSIGVSVNGNVVWANGFGYADIENGVECNENTVMRIASISKPISMTLLARLMDMELVDLDAPIQKYVTYFPEKSFQDETATITVRHLLSHLGGIRHYKKKPEEAVNPDEKTTEKVTGDKEVPHLPDTEFNEIWSYKKYENIKDAVMMFANDPLVGKPGSKYVYTTHGFTLLSAVIEGITSEKFDLLLNQLFTQLGMHRTYLDQNEPIIMNRAKFYYRSKRNHRIMNSPAVDNSYKWAGGGLLSTVGDLLVFANFMLASYQQTSSVQKSPALISKSTVERLWTLVSPPEQKSIDSKQSKVELSTKNKGYGMAWSVTTPDKFAMNKMERSGQVGHSGGAVGASSYLLICPSQSDDNLPVNGVCVALLTNVENCPGMSQLCNEICAVFLQ